jgi:thiamine biosynthesis lipoprotein
MKEVRLLMGMPITLEIIDQAATAATREGIFSYFQTVEERFSPFKDSSEVCRLNAGQLKPADYSADLRLILELSAQTKAETNGYFDIYQNGRCNPSGLVKGWAIYHAANLLKEQGFKNYYINAGGDIEASGLNSAGQAWRVGIANPFNPQEIVKIVKIDNCGIATSGTYRRGQHIYNPLAPGQPLTEIISLTVIGPNVYEADRFATAAFAMGRTGLDFIETRPGLEAYLIDSNGQATLTSGFKSYVL